MSGTDGIVFDIQHYAVHDGPGIRTLVFLKGCPLRCRWCYNPESQSPRPTLRRIAARCEHCLRCAGACPPGAIHPVDGSAVIDRTPCAWCGDMPCVAACPSQALSISGRWMGVAEVVERVAADRAFYRNSGGGVTFSGGEPFAQPMFLTALLDACRGLGIHTAVETCGLVDVSALLAAEPLVDLFLYDVKVADPARHAALTGLSNDQILANLAALAVRVPDKILLRVPLVPGFTDDPVNLTGIAALAQRHGLRAVSVVPYHPFGRDKYEEFGLPEPPEVPPVTPASVDAALGLFARHGLAADLA